LDFSFRKEERLLNRKAFEFLVQKGTVYFSYPFRVIWFKAEEEQPFPVKVAFTVPKKKFKRANKRNFLKRRMREAFRLHKNPFYSELEKNNQQIILLIVYIGTDILPYHDIEKKIAGIFRHISEHIK
jgi:ribonuclease P protein component